MPCKDSHISISKYSSVLDIAKGDSLEIIDYKTHSHYQPITGNEINSITNRHIKTSDFLLLFLSEKDSTQSTGFKLQFECPSIRDEGSKKNQEEEEESGSGFDIDE
uniref:CUB domain-containing protein n=1 Tax=Amphimedon queenslandica TaxID=400682 RepID=A0A1X7VT84_AMPQE